MLYSSEYRRLQEINSMLRDCEQGLINIPDKEYAALVYERGLLTEKLFGRPRRDLIHAIKTGRLISAWQKGGER